MTYVHLWAEAAAFGARAHEDHYRKDGRTPYFSHPTRVAMTLVYVFGCRDAKAITAAFLHDTIEDSTTDYDDVAERFGKDVADMVAALTKNMILPKRRREADYDERLAKADWRARLVKLADQYDNYSDAMMRPRSQPGKKRADTAVKVRRAMRLAQPDAKRHSESARAIKACRDLLTRGLRNRD